MYDAIIIGAGYAGSRLSGLLDNFDVLVIDKSGIGEKDVSIATFLRIVPEDAIKNVYDKYVLMTIDGDKETYEFQEPVFCFVDYAKLCKNEITHQIVKEEVIEYGSGYVKTKDEIYKSKIVVDCTGIQGSRMRKKAGFNLPPYTISLKYTTVLNGSFIDDDSMYFIIGHSNAGGWIYPINSESSEFGFAVRHKNNRSIYPDIEIPRTLMGLELKSDYEKRAQYSFGFVKKVVHKNMIIFGDSCGMAHPTYMMQIHYAHRISSKLAESIKAYIRGEKNKLVDYQRWWIKMLKKASGNLARGYAFWDMNVEKQIRSAKIQIRSKIKPESIYSHMWALNEDYDVYAKNPPKLTDYPPEIYLRFLKHKISYSL